MVESRHSSYCQTDSAIGILASYIHNISAQILITIMTVVITIEVFFRYILGAGFTFSQEICSLSFLLLVFLTQANTWQQDRHIRMDIFYNNFNTVFKKISDFLTILCGLVLYGALAWQGIADFQYQFEVNESTPELVWPLWPFSLIIVISSAIICLLLFRFTFLMFTRKAR